MPAIDRSLSNCRYIAVDDLFQPADVARIREQAEGLPTVHSNAGVQGKRNIGTKESLLVAMPRERFEWVYERLQMIVKKMNDEHWGFEELGDAEPDSLQIASYHVSFYVIFI